MSRLCEQCGDYKELCGHDWLNGEIERLKLELAESKSSRQRLLNQSLTAIDILNSSDDIIVRHQRLADLYFGDT